MPFTVAILTPQVPCHGILFFHWAPAIEFPGWHNVISYNNCPLVFALS